MSCSEPICHWRCFPLSFSAVFLCVPSHWKRNRLHFTQIVVDTSFGRVHEPQPNALENAQRGRRALHSKSNLSATATKHTCTRAREWLAAFEELRTSEIVKIRLVMRWHGYSKIQRLILVSLQGESVCVCVCKMSTTTTTITTVPLPKCLHTYVSCSLIH